LFFVKSEQALLMRLDSKGGDVPNIIWVHGYKVVANESIEINKMIRKDLEYEI
jgi:RIO-like serine/threonine protein kinase